MILFRRQIKPKRLYTKDKPLPSSYQWHVTSIDDLRQIMPSNDRIEELIQKMENDKTIRRYGEYDWKVE